MTTFGLVLLVGGLSGAIGYLIGLRHGSEDTPLA